MASPPFNITETQPGDSDIVSQFPANERTFRDTVEDWILTEHDTQGRHKIPNIDTTARDALTSVGVGTLIFNVTLNVLQICTDDSPVTWVNVGEGALSAPSGTRLGLQQTAAPTGWTKDTTHNNKAMRLVSGTVTTGGTTAFTSVFTSRTIAQANLPNVNLVATSLTLSNSTNIVHCSGSIFGSDAGTGGSGGDIMTRSTGTIANSVIGGNVPLGGSGTAMDFAVQYVDFIIAEKD